MPSWCHCHSLSLAPVKSRLVLPFWYRLTQVVPDKGPLNVCVSAASDRPHSSQDVTVITVTQASTQRTPVFSRGWLLPRIGRTDVQWSQIWFNGPEPRVVGSYWRSFPVWRRLVNCTGSTVCVVAKERQDTQVSFRYHVEKPHTHVHNRKRLTTKNCQTECNKWNRSSKERDRPLMFHADMPTSVSSASTAGRQRASSSRKSCVGTTSSSRTITCFYAHISLLSRVTTK